MSSNNKKLQKLNKTVPKKLKQKSGTQSLDRAGRNLGADTKMIVNNTSVVDNFGWRREKVADVNGTSAFTVAQSLYLNPGNSVLFPVSSRANSIYEEYEMDIEFDYEPVAYSSIGSTASPGLVVLVTNYDSSDPEFTSLTQAENYDHSVRLLPYERGTHIVRSKSGRMRGYPLGDYFVANTHNLILPSGVTTGEKFYNLGRFSLITEGNATTTKIGELYVRYRRKMIRQKQAISGLTGTEKYAHYTTVPTTGAGLLSLSAQTGNTFIPLLNASGVTSTIGSGVAGRFLIVWHVAAATSATVSTNFVNATGGTMVNFFTAENSGETIVSGSATTACTILVVVDFTGTGLITIPDMTISGAGLGEFIMTQIPDDAVFSFSPSKIFTELRNNLLALEKKCIKDQDFLDFDVIPQRQDLSESIQIDLKKILARVK